MNGRDFKYTRIRRPATGALAAIAAVGAIASTPVLAAQPRAHHHHHHHHRVRLADASQDRQAYLDAIQRLVDNSTITAAQGQAVDNQVRQGYVDPSTLTGFTRAQLQAVEQALGNVKRAQAPGNDSSN